jgi:hypothetical protein
MVAVGSVPSSLFARFPSLAHVIRIGFDKARRLKCLLMPPGTDMPRQGAGFEIFNSGVENGMSASLCEAAAKLIELGKGRDASVTWGQNVTLFMLADGDVLLQAARLFRTKEPRHEEPLEGCVVKLSGESVTQDR